MSAIEGQSCRLRDQAAAYSLNFGQPDNQASARQDEDGAAATVRMAGIHRISTARFDLLVATVAPP